MVNKAYVFRQWKMAHSEIQAPSTLNLPLTKKLLQYYYSA